MGKYQAYRNATQFTVPKTMKAVIMAGQGFENMKVTDVPTPTPGANQLLCRVDAAGVCTSILKLVAQGSQHKFINGWDLQKWPVILGDEGSVTVVQVGSNLTSQYKAGQRFGIQPAVDVDPINHRERYTNGGADMHKCAVGYSLGGNLAEYILIQEEVLQGQCLLPLPDDRMSYFGVSMGEPISCVYSAQERQYHIHKASPFAPREPKLGLLPGGTAVVIGAGAMGRMHAELAIRFKPKTLIVSDMLQERLNIVNETLGEKAKNAGTTLLALTPDKLKDAVMKASDGRGADDIILAVGIQPVQQAALELLGHGGVATLFGGLPKGKNILNVDAIAVHYEEIKLVGSSGGEPSDLKATLDAIASGDINPGNYVYGIGSLKHVPQVLQMIEQSKVDGKVIIYPHAEIDELMPVQNWDSQKEVAYLDANLRG